MLKNFFLLIASITLLNCAGKNTGNTNTESTLKSGPALSVAVVAENNNEAEGLLIQHILDHAFKYSNFDIIDQKNLKSALEQNSYNEMLGGTERQINAVKADSKLTVGGFKRDDGTILLSLKLVCNSGKMLHAVSEDISQDNQKEASLNSFKDLLQGLTGNNSNCNELKTGHPSK